MTTPGNEQPAVQGEMIEALRRSGYLIESEISLILSSLGFFVDSNQAIKDPLTGKSREIDLLAELYRPLEEHLGVTSSIKFAFEAKNNPYPLVLLTRFESSPNADVYDSLREAITTPDSITYEPEDQFWGALLENNLDAIFTQYCSFKRKRDGKDQELMAFHPDELHDSLAKIVQYCDEQVLFWEQHKPDEYFRDFLYLPVVVLGGELHELYPGDPPQLKPVQRSRLLLNYYRGDEPKTALIYAVTMDGFRNFIDGMIKIQDQIQQNMLGARRKTTRTTSP